MSSGTGVLSGGVDASRRERRPLRCGEPTFHEPVTEDGVTLRLARFRGGSLGPVVLSPGFGVSSVSFTIDTVATNFPEYLFERGYDVWVLDYRASPCCPRVLRSSPSTRSLATTTRRSSTPFGRSQGRSPCSSWPIASVRSRC